MLNVLRSPCSCSPFISDFLSWLCAVCTGLRACSKIEKKENETRNTENSSVEKGKRLLFFVSDSEQRKQWDIKKHGQKPEKRVV